MTVFNPPYAVDPTPLSTLTTLEVGGGPDALCITTSETEAIEVAQWSITRGVRLYPLGGGSNVLCADEGLRGVVLCQRDQTIRYSAPNSRGEVLVEVSAGYEWSALVGACVERDLAGIECLAGIPGQVGAAPIQNIGAYGQSLSDTCVEVRLYHLKHRQVERWTPSQCQWSYRDSAFKRALGTHLILGLTLRLTLKGVPTLKYPQLKATIEARREAGDDHPSLSLGDVYAEVLALRAAKSMVWDAQDVNRRSAGSFFLNPILSAEDGARVVAKARELGYPDPPLWPEPNRETSPSLHVDARSLTPRVKIPAAWLIERSGCTKGYGEGAVGLSSRHTLAIVNRGGATAGEVVSFARHIQHRVWERFEVALCPEPNLWGFTTSPLPPFTL